MAVREAERVTGLQISVYVGAVGDDARADAEHLFVTSGSHARPAVLMLVAPGARRVEIVTAPSVRQRVSDDACADVVQVMIEWFQRGEISPGIVAGLARLTEAAGPGRTPADGEELPDVIGADDLDPPV
jgi:uncharacterized membrane protein